LPTVKKPGILNPPGCPFPREEFGSIMPIIPGSFMAISDTNWRALIDQRVAASDMPLFPSPGG